MNHDHDLLSRLVDYHDHIAAPPVSVLDDLQRGRRRVRRKRGLLAGGVAIGLASVIAAVTVLTGDGEADRQQPIGPPTSDATSEPGGGALAAPLHAPESILDVRELGFHVEPVPGFEPGGWEVLLHGQSVALQWEDAANADVFVTVRYQGMAYPDAGYGLTRSSSVKVHDVLGRYYHEGEAAGDDPDRFVAELVWEYAPGSLASVGTISDRGDPGPERLRAALVEIAEAVSAGGETLGLPFRIDTYPSSLPELSTLDRVGVWQDGGWHAALSLTFGDTWLAVGPDLGPVTCEQGYDGGGTERFTYRGHQGCLSGWGPTNEPRTTTDVVGGIHLKVEDTLRSYTPSHAGGAAAYPIADVKQLLAELTMAPLDDPSTWFDLEAALGG